MNLTEKASFFDPATIYGEEVIPDAILDLDVVDNVLRATLPQGQYKTFGRWTGPTPLQISNAQITSNQTIVTTMNDGRTHETPQVRFDLHTIAKAVGSGQHEAFMDIPNFSDVRFDWHNETLGTMYSVAKDPKTSALARLSLTTQTGVVITGSNTWSSSYDVFKTLNRKVDHASDGLLSDRANLTITHAYPSPILFVGYNFKNLRADFPTTGYKIEYSIDGTNWVLFDTQTTTGNVMGHYEKLIADPILVLKVRFVASNTGPSGCGYFNVLTAGWGKIEKFKEVNFHPDYFDVTETETEKQVTPKSVSANLSGTSFGLNNYIRAVLEIDQNANYYVPNVPNTGDLVKFNKIEFASIPLTDTLPYLELPPGKYYYRFAVVDTLRGKGVVHFAPGSSIYPIGKLHLFDVGVAADAVTRLLEGEGELNISSTTSIALRVQMTGAAATFSQIPTTLQLKGKLATLELWRIGDSDDEFVHPLPPPPDVTKCVAFTKLYSAVQSGTSLDNLFISPTAVMGAYWYTAGQHVFIYINKPFRLWRMASTHKYQGKLKITYYGNAAVDMSSRQYTLVGNDGVWELATKDMPPGVYKFEFGTTYRIDKSWWFEPVDNPKYADVVISNKILPMVSNNDQGQIAAASDSYSPDHQPSNAFGAVPSFNGWATINGTYPSTAPVTTPSWIEIDLGKVVTINAIGIFNRTPADPNLPMKGFRLAGWNATTTSWETIVEVADRNMSDPGGVSRHEGLGDQTYQKFRVYALSRYAASSGALVTIGKIELYHTGENLSADNTFWL